MIDYRYTRHQVARGSHPDAVNGAKAYLFKNVSMLRLTYQIRLLTVPRPRAARQLVIRLPQSAQLSGDLRRFHQEHSATLKLQKVPMGEWTRGEAAELRQELRTIDRELSALPPVSLPAGEWPESVARTLGQAPASLAQCFIDVDGEPLFDRLQELVDVAIDRDCPIFFQ